MIKNVTTAFRFSYGTLFSELYFPIPENIFYFVVLKYIIGTSHQLLVPIAVLTCQVDIRKNVAEVYRKGGTSQTTMEMTYEELQRNLGLGVDIG